MTLPIALRRRQPVAVLAIICTADLLLALPDVSGAHPYFAIFGFVLALFSVAAARPARVSAPVAALAGAAIYLAGLVANPEWTHDWRDFLSYCLPVTMLWVVGNQFRGRRLQAEAAAARADWLESERAGAEQRAAEQERARIARELHDVVAHSLSVIVVQAGAARRVASQQPGAPMAALASIETTGRQAMAEMRRMLGILRKGDDGDAPLAPQPGLDRLGALLEQVRAAGLKVDLRAEGGPVPLPPGLDVSAYRIVQEALTNSLRHAGARCAEVIIAYGDGELRLSVRDDGVGADSGPRQAGGLGLAGMRERVEMFGGRLDTTGEAGKGFSVTATLPLVGAP